MLTVAQKRKHAAANPNATVNGPSPFHVSSVAAVASQRTTNAADKDEGSSDEELFDTDAQWYWRDDKRYVWWLYSVRVTCTCVVKGSVVL